MRNGGIEIHEISQHFHNRPVYKRNTSIKIHTSGLPSNFVAVEQNEKREKIRTIKKLYIHDINEKRIL